MWLLSLRARIFIALIFLVLVASFLIAGVTIFQYSEQSNAYHEQRLERKENQLKKRLYYLLNQHSNQGQIDIENIFSEHMKEITDVLNINFRIYSLDGPLLLYTPLMQTLNEEPISKIVLQQLIDNPNDRFINVSTADGIRKRSSYFYITDLNQMPLGIVNVPYYDDDSLSSMELNAFLIRLVQVYVLMLIIAVVLAFFVSSYITRSLETISTKLNQTKLTNTNTKIELTKPSKEISSLVEAYNHMVDELEESAIKLAKSQRELAWREMAKQVAHEIKNPLTPMRLSIQHFEQQVTKNDTKWNEKVREFSQSLIQQIDTMSSIASTFSQFATMPTGNSERINVSEVVSRTMELYSEASIHLYIENNIHAELDATLLVRIINNLVNNAIYACDDIKDPKITVTFIKQNSSLLLSIEDNGKGISEEVQQHIFEPTFTTKTSGMGLGLSMVKSIIEGYGGNIQVTSELNTFTRFEVWFPNLI
jgi:signal transduction histidine kinase